jgi:L-methionine (R)-S-oxide reductase
MEAGVMDGGKTALFRELADQLEALLAGESDLVANAANMAALIYHGLPGLNWAGFYFTRPLPLRPPHAGERRLGAPERELVLGPFQGKPACVRIRWGEGVCGTAAARGASVVVPDVHEFPGHIACDEASRSELVVPLLAAGQSTIRVVGVLDLDSPELARFDEEDRAGCEVLAAVLLRHHPDWP